MAEITQEFVKQGAARCRAMAPWSSKRSSNMICLLVVGDVTMTNERASENYVADNGADLRHTGPIQTLRNIVRAATFLGALSAQHSGQCRRAAMAGGVRDEWIERIGEIYHLNAVRLDCLASGGRSSAGFEAAQVELETAVAALFAEAERQLERLGEAAPEGKPLRHRSTIARG